MVRQAKRSPKSGTTRISNALDEEVGSYVDAVLLEVMLRLVVQVRRVQQGFRRDAPHVEASAT